MGRDGGVQRIRETGGSGGDARLVMRIIFDEGQRVGFWCRAGRGKTVCVAPSVVCCTEADSNTNTHA